jgi:hypothetical protein
MFDNFGNVLCTDCKSRMNLLGSNRERAAFKCTNTKCGRIRSFCLLQPDGRHKYYFDGNREKRGMNASPA